LVTLLLAAIGFVWGRLRSDMVALIALMILTLSGVITTQEALLGFSNPIVVMMVGLFVVGGAIFKTGLAKVIGARLLKLAGDSQIKLFLLVIAGTALIGAFVSNTGTVALMLPIVVSMTAASGTSPSRFLMPLAFASSLGGMMTLIGTPPNLVISEIWEEYSHQPMSFFTFFPAGAICLLIGTLLLIPLSKWFLSGKGTKGDRTGDSQKSIADLVKEYGLEKALYRVTIPATSPLVGKTLHELNLRSTFSIDVLEVRKGERGLGLLKKITQHAGDPDTPISAGETLYVRGDLDNVSHFAGTYKLKVDFSEEHGLEFYDVGIAEIMPLPQASVLNRRIADLGLRAQFGLNVLGIRRKN
ncbi:MAG: SLC13 family permease, partial [Muribaculaceae bacterium]|nr:SLC13 family permease [Muribaculaceae bacterium]